MTYLDRLNCFWQFVNIEPLSTGQKVLYLALLDINNSCRWAVWFTTTNSILQFKTGLSRKGINEARNHLIQVGLISYKKGRGNQAGSYSLLKFECNILPADGDASYTQTAHKLHTERDTDYPQTATLIDIDKDIDKDNSASVSVRKNEINLYQAYDENIGAITGMIAEELDGYAELTCPEVVIYAIRQAALNNKKSCGYVKAICKSLLNEGIKTPLDLERHIQEYEQKKQDKTSKSSCTDKLAEQKARWGI